MTNIVRLLILLVGSWADIAHAFSLAMTRLNDFDASTDREELDAKMGEMEAMARERESANSGRDVSQDALARMAIRNAELKVGRNGIRLARKRRLALPSIDVLECKCPCSRMSVSSSFPSFCCHCEC